MRYLALPVTLHRQLVSWRVAPIFCRSSADLLRGPRFPCRTLEPALVPEALVDAAAPRAHRMHLESALLPLLLASLNSGAECCGLGSLGGKRLQMGMSNQGTLGSAHLKSNPGAQDADGNAAEFLPVQMPDGRLSIAHSEYRNVAPKLLLAYHRSSRCPWLAPRPRALHGGGLESLRK